jgi:hypothetical protein
LPEHPSCRPSSSSIGERTNRRAGLLAGFPAYDRDRKGPQCESMKLLRSPTRSSIGTPFRKRAERV